MLFPCPECKHNISDQALACPHCGNPIQQRAQTQVVVQSGPNPAVAILLSLIIPGLGQLYKGQPVNGIFWFLLVVACYVAAVGIGLLMHLVCLIGAGMRSGAKSTAVAVQTPAPRAPKASTSTASASTTPPSGRTLYQPGAAAITPKQRLIFAGAIVLLLAIVVGAGQSESVQQATEAPSDETRVDPTPMKAPTPSPEEADEPAVKPIVVREMTVAQNTHLPSVSAPRPVPNRATGTYWVTSDRLNRRTCPSTDCGVVGFLFFREVAKVQEWRNDWARVTHAYDASCRNGASEYVETGRADCSPTNGIDNGKFAEWVFGQHLDTERPADPAANAKGVYELIKGSDDYGHYKKAFADATDNLVRNGRCSKADFKKMGGWRKSTTTYASQPVYFTYCGGMTLRNRIYLNATSGLVWSD